MGNHVGALLELFLPSNFRGCIEMIVNGTTYNDTTPRQIIDILENARKSGVRVRIFLGYTETGRDWLEEHDTIGIIARSCGKVKIPILLRNSTSSSGFGIMTQNIVKITIDKKIVYQHPHLFASAFSM